MKLDKFREFLINQGEDTAAHMNICFSTLVNLKFSEYLVSYSLVCPGFEPTPMFNNKAAILFTKDPF